MHNKRVHRESGPHASSPTESRLVLGQDEHCQVKRPAGRLLIRAGESEKQDVLPTLLTLCEMPMDDVNKDKLDSINHGDNLGKPMALETL